MTRIQPPSFGELLRGHRVAAGLSQGALADLAGLSLRAINDLERGARRAPHRDTVRLLADALRIADQERADFEAAVVRRRRPRSLSSSTRAQPPHNLPAQPTRLIGRASEVAAVTRLIRHDDVRLVTLTGPGGVGKTRLAAQVAAALLDFFPAGVFFVTLAAIREPGLVSSAIAVVLGIKEKGDQTLHESVTAHLCDRRLLLVLDNFEHLAKAGPLVVDLLAACPLLKVLVTSRASVHVRGEHIFPVPPLAVPNLAQFAQGDALEQYAAIDLFVQRARDVKLDFALTATNGPIVASICRRLDGLPLAIELAAARIPILPPKMLLAHLVRTPERAASVVDGLTGISSESSLHLLTGGAWDLPERLRTMRGAISWSYDLLNAGEQRLFRRLACFAGGFTLEAARAVCDADGGLGIGVLEGLSSLADKSLLQLHESEGNETRFAMLETIHEYARELLMASDEVETLWRSYADYYVTLAEDANQKMQGSEQMVWLQRLEAEHDNLRVILRWTAECQEEIGLRLAGLLWRFWFTRGHFSEGREWLEQLLALNKSNSETESVMMRARALNGAGVLAFNQGDFKRAAALYEDSLALYRKLGHKESIAYVLNNLAGVANHQSAYGRAAALLEESVALLHSLGDKRNIALSLISLGIVVMDQGDYDRALVLFKEGRALSQDLGDKWSIAFSLACEGDVELRQGHYDRAAACGGDSLALYQELGDKGGIAHSLLILGNATRKRRDYGSAALLLDESLTLRQALGDKQNMALVLHSLAEMAREQHDVVRAGALYEESLTLHRDIGSKFGIVVCLEGIAKMAHSWEQPEQAARLFAAAEALRHAIGAPTFPAEQAEYQRVVADVRAALRHDVSAKIWAAEYAVPLEQAVAEALEHCAARCHRANAVISARVS